MDQQEPLLRLSDEFLEKYKGRQPDWGFDGLGYVVYLRTYSRRKEDGTQEEWWETVRRAVEGNFDIEVQRLRELGKLTPEKLEELRKEMERFYDLTFNLVMSPPGRGLWMSGTDYERRSGDALNNCWLIAVRPQKFNGEKHPSPAFPACFVFDMAMKGGGVGANIQRRNTDLMPPVKNRVRLTIYCRDNHPDVDELKELGVVLYRTTLGLRFFYHPQGQKGIRNRIKEHRKYRRLYRDASGKRLFLMVPDSREGWCQALRTVIEASFYGYEEVVLDISQIRCRGSLIRGFGGVASGPAPLVQMLQRVNQILNSRVNNKLRPVDWGDIIQNIGVCVVSGNVRRTALILIGDQDDKEFIESKNYDLPQNMVASQWRWASNNSVDISEDTSRDVLREMARNIYYNGEPGYTNITLARNYGRIIDGYQPGIDGEVEGFNPCGEISLPNGSPCNLFEINLPRVHQLIASGKEDESLYEEVCRLAARYAYRVTFRHYEWDVTREVVQRHRRLGVGITGFTDWVLLKFGERAVLGFEDGKPIYNPKVTEMLDRMYKAVRRANDEHARELEASPSIKVTTVKPSGTLSILMGVSPGQHFHWSAYMIRRVRIAANNPLVDILRNCGYHVEPAIQGMDEQGKPIYDWNTMVVEFPIKAPTANHPLFQSAADVSLEEQAAIQALLQTYWADNSVSATLSFHKPKPKPVYFADGTPVLDENGNPVMKVHPKDEEAVIERITDLLDRFKGMLKSTTLLPYSSESYPQMPFEAITREQYEEMVSRIRYKPWELMNNQVVMDDDVDSSMECAGGACPIR